MMLESKSKRALAGALLGAGLAMVLPRPAHAAPIVGDAIAMPVPDSGFPIDEAKIACSSSICLVVWADEGIRAARFRISDERLLDRGIVISSNPAAEAPNVEFGGDVFLVVWSEQGDIRGSRRDASTAAAVGPASFVISGAPGVQTDPAVASFGLGFLVVWIDRRDAAPGVVRDDVYGRRVSATDGALLDPADVAIVAGAGRRTSPAIARSEGNYMVAWGSPSGVAYQHVLTDARLLGGVVATALEGARPSVTYELARYVIAAEGGATPSVQFFDGAGGSMSGPVALSNVPAADGSSVVVVDDPDGFTAFWFEGEAGEEHELRSVRISFGAEVLAPAATIEAGLGHGDPLPLNAGQLDTGAALLHYARFPIGGGGDAVDSILRLVQEEPPPPPPPSPPSSGGGCFTIPIGCSVGGQHGSGSGGVAMLLLGALLARRARRRRAHREAERAARSAS